MRKMGGLDEAIQLAQRKIECFPNVYKAYVTDHRMFDLLVADCRKQINLQAASSELCVGVLYE